MSNNDNPLQYSVCFECHKAVHLDQIIVNFGLCNRCFDDNYEWYLATEQEPCYGFSGHA